MAYAAITVEGGLFPPDLLDSIAAGEAPGQQAREFGVEGRLGDEIQAAFSDIRAYWDAFERRLANAPADASRTTLTREYWLIPLLERLGYSLAFQRAGAMVGGENFAISHRAGDEPESPPVHIVAFDESLGSRARGRRSPHALVQEYLNRGDALWGLVTNGEQLRLLRDSERLSRPTYLEFDLRGMIEGNLYNEFVLLYRLLHRSRLPRGAGDAAACHLERLYQQGLDEGGRVREGLRDGVEAALEGLGSAFLLHPESAELRRAIAEQRLDADTYYRQLLRLIYRLLFLFVAEERKLVFPPEDVANRDRQEIYSRYYSISRLRDRCERAFAGDGFADVWPGLVETFRLFRDETAAQHLGLTALNGELFGDAACRDLEQAACENSAILRAIFQLSTFRDEKIRRRVTYAALDVEELGSVYESLLDFRPVVDLDDAKPFRLETGSDRKTTGSYYTPPELVRELIESALVPVIEQRLAAAKTWGEKDAALLSMNVCDPASGSGHFLLAAARRLGRELARVRTGEAEPAPEAYREAVRDVIRTCIYAVDKNPLAVDLCKVALWIEGHGAGFPLSFLDHHVKCGDSLVGVFDLDVLGDGIPDAAYKPVTGDDKTAATTARKLNKAARDTGQRGLAPLTPELPTGLPADFHALATMEERSAGDVRAKEEIYAQLRQQGSRWSDLHIACDLWTAAFFTPFAPVDDFHDPLVPTTETVRRAVNQPKALDGRVVGQAVAAAERLRFFHWPLEFPEVFHQGGFDTVLGNPPWERIKLQEQEFFAARDPEIATAPNKAARQRLITTLDDRKPELAAEFAEAKHDAEAASKMIREGGRFPLTGRGDVNTYSVFAEQMTRLLGPPGRAGVIVPTGIATDDTNKHFFRWLGDHGRLVSLFDFENREGLFHSVDSRMKFSLLATTGAERPAAPFEAAFFLTRPEQLRDPERRFTLSADDIALLNPNTRTCPIFRTARDAEITKQLYRAAPVLIREGDPEINPWGVTFKRMFDMSNDSHLFRTRQEMGALGATLGADGRFRRGDEVWLPLYEAKMIHQFDHRFATYEPDGGTRKVTTDEHANPNFVVAPRYWVNSLKVHGSLDVVRPKSGGWLLGFRKVTNTTNERTLIFSTTPPVAAGGSFELMVPGDNYIASALGLVSNLGMIILDYAARQKIGGMNVGYFVVKQLPVFPPDTYTPALLDQIVPRVLELVYTAHDMAPFARDCGYQGPPFTWDEERRAHLRAELDGIYAHLYGLNRDDFAYILDTFPIVRRHDEQHHGEYRTKRLCLEAYDFFAPEALRELNDEVKAVELGLRSLISRELGSAEAIPPHLYEKIVAEQQRHLGSRATEAYATSLPMLLESCYMLDLQRIIIAPETWPAFEPRFGSKTRLRDAFTHLNELRNPLSHLRTLDESKRAAGEAAIRWFREALGTA